MAQREGVCAADEVADAGGQTGLGATIQADPEVDAMCQADGGSSDGPPVDTAPSGSNSTHGAGAPGASEAHAGASPAGGGLGGQRSRQYTHFVLCLLAASEGGLGCEHGAVLSAALTQDLAALSRLLPARCLILGLFQAPEAASLRPGPDRYRITAGDLGGRIRH